MPAQTLKVWLDQYSHYVPVGELQRVEDLHSEAVFLYNKDYLARAGSKPLSLSLPLTDEPVDMQITRAFFGGLMPDGALRRQLAREERFDSGDFYSFIELLNNETLGALIFTANNQRPGADAAYKEFTAADLRNFAQSPLSQGIPVLKESRLSLAGAMAKIGLYKHQDTWMLPVGAAPSTHIIKVCNEYPGLVYNEAICLRAAKLCGLRVPDFELIDVGLKTPLLAIKRYDRDIPKIPRTICGLPVPKRLHQEDCCQAMGRDEIFKYEANTADYVSDIKMLVMSVAKVPFLELDEFVKQLSFDFFIGNCDNHAKNYAFLYSEDLASAGISPHYDCVSTTIYPALDTKMGISFSPKRDINGIESKDVAATMKKLYGSKQRGLEIFTRIGTGIQDCLAQSCDDLSKEYGVAVKKVAEQIIEQCQTRIGQVL